MISEDDSPKMETEPPDKSRDLYTSRNPVLNDVAIAENERLNSMSHVDMTPDELSLCFQLRTSIQLEQARQKAACYQKTADTRHSRPTPQNDEWQTYLPRAFSTEKDFLELTDDANLVGYQKDYDGLVSLKEQKLATRSSNGRRTARPMGRVPLHLRLHFFPANPNSESKSKARSPIGRETSALVERVTPKNHRSFRGPH
ncbi:hypothetical protein TNCV_3816531 [Trichonephila clavipes]|nr:hypothetical protein TNCV_3816531 [Trichonephila clavipes]